ncbi:MAG: zinc ABC transporter substrate-binding protein, partial [Pseudomonadota bacterium]
MTLPTPSSRAARLVAGVTLGAAISMNAATARAQDAALDVVASFSVIADMAARVGGERIALTTLVGPDEDAHVYEPRPRDAAR